MKVRWTGDATRQLTAAHEYLAADSNTIAEEIVDRIVRSVSQLADFPESGRVGRVKNTRELVIVNTPYVIAYRIRENTVEILAVLHGRRRWPKRF